MFLERLNKNGIKDNKFYYDAEYSAFTASNIQMPNCTAYAYGRSGEIANQNIRPSGLSKNNAKNWYVNSSSTWVRSSTPKVGAVACWTGDLGHVAIVERVMDDGSCLVSQSNYTRDSSKMDVNFFQLKQYKMEVGKVTSGVGLVFQGYLLNPFVDLNTVERDTSKNQVKVLAEQIRARKAANGEAYEGLYIPLGLYDVLETKVDGYTWAKIADGVWFATNDDEEWTETYVASSQETPENTEEEKPISSVPNILKGEKWELDKFFDELNKILNSKTRYLLGGIGRYDGDTRLFDCVGLFKSILWNYPAKPSNYNVTYPDVNVGGMKSRAKVQAFDKDKMQRGMLVFIGTEHIGMVYDDRIIECTPAFNNCVQLTTLEQRSDKPWDSMGYADFLKYPSSEPTEPSKEPSDIDTLLDELQSSIATLQAENKELSSKNAELEKELANTKQELENANSKLEQIRKVVS